MNKFFLSIITPIYNTPSHIIHKLMLSIKKIKKIKNLSFEHIIIDDGSKNYDTLEYLEKIKHIKLDHKGQSYARNEALKLAKGKYIFFLDSDDTIYENLLVELFNIDRKNNFDILSFPTIWLNEKEKIIEISKAKKVFNINNINNVHEFYNDTMLCNKIYKRNFLLKNHINFPNNKMPFEDDVFLLKCFFCNPKYLNTKNIFYYYWKYSNMETLSSSKSEIKIIEFRNKQILPFFNSINSLSPPIIFIGVLYVSEHITKSLFKIEYNKKVNFSLIKESCKLYKKISKYFKYSLKYKIWINFPFLYFMYRFILYTFYRKLQ